MTDKTLAIWDAAIARASGLLGAIIRKMASYAQTDRKLKLGKEVSQVERRSWQARWQLDETTPIRVGGHAIVRHVVARDDGREGALKILNDDAQEREERRFRLREEVNALKALASGVPKLYDTNALEPDESEPLYFVMEWIPGPTLGQRVTKRVFSLDDALLCTDALLVTLEAMHALPLVHRDLKPDNIILRNGSVDVPVIIDLGLAWADNRSDEGYETKHGQEMGNRFLRLPEFAPGRAHRDPRSDVTLAAGLLLFMLSGRPPRLLSDERGLAPHQSLAESIPEVVRNDPRWTRLSRVFNVAFQTELVLRFQSVASLREALGNLDPAVGREDVLSPAIERFKANLESAQWTRRHERQAQIGRICAAFDTHLRLLFQPTGLSLPGSHGFNAAGRVYTVSMGLQVPDGGTVCSLRHEVEIGDAELQARYFVNDQGGEPYYQGPLADVDGLKEVMWENADQIVTAALDEFTRRTALP